MNYTPSNFFQTFPGTHTFYYFKVWLWQCQIWTVRTLVIVVNLTRVPQLTSGFRSFNNVLLISQTQLISLIRFSTVDNRRPFLKLSKAGLLYNHAKVLKVALGLGLRAPSQIHSSSSHFPKTFVWKSIPKKASLEISKVNKQAHKHKSSKEKAAITHSSRQTSAWWCLCSWKLQHVTDCSPVTSLEVSTWLGVDVSFPQNESCEALRSAYNCPPPAAPLLM